MQQYLAKRLLLAVPALLGVTLVVFMAVRFLPGDVVESLAGEWGASPEFRKAIEERYSLNEGMVQQYFRWLGHALI